MKVLKLKLLYFNNKSTKVKTTILLIFCFFCLFNLSAQKESNIKLKIETGFLWASDEESSGILDEKNLGFFLRIEPTLKTSKNTFVGLRIGGSFNTQKIGNHNPLLFNLYPNISSGIIQFIDIDNRIISLVPTFNYYLTENKFRPYLSFGMGYFFLTNYTDVSQRGIVTPSEELLKVSVKNQVGFLLRGGLDFGKLIVGLEYNYIPKVDVEIPNGEIIGIVENSYIGLSFGYSIGVGKSSK